jgi:hypothetical protein
MMAALAEMKLDRTVFGVPELSANSGYVHDHVEPSSTPHLRKDRGIH